MSKCNFLIIVIVGNLEEFNDYQRACWPLWLLCQWQRFYDIQAFNCLIYRS